MTEEGIRILNEALSNIGIENVKNIALFTEGETNGDVITTMFPDWEVDMGEIESKQALTEPVVYSDGSPYLVDLSVDTIAPFVKCWINREANLFTCFNLDWWNSPYEQKGEE